MIEWITDEQWVGVGQTNTWIEKLQSDLNTYVAPIVGATQPLTVNGKLDQSACDLIQRGWQNYKRINWIEFDDPVLVGASLACGVTWPPAAEDPPQGTPHTYVVQSGDSLTAIANEFVGDSTRFQELWASNPHKTVQDNTGAQPGAFTSMNPGDVLWLPATWPSTPGDIVPPDYTVEPSEPIPTLPPAAFEPSPSFATEIPAPSWWPVSLPWPPPKPIGWPNELPWPPALPLPPGSTAFPIGINWEAIKPSWWPAELPWPLEVPEGFWQMIPATADTLEDQGTPPPPPLPEPTPPPPPPAQEPVPPPAPAPVKKSSSAVGIIAFGLLTIVVIGVAAVAGQKPEEI